MMTSQILKSVDFTKIQKPRYLENEKLFSSNKKNNYTSRATLWQKFSFVATVTFKEKTTFSMLLM